MIVESYMWACAGLLVGLLVAVLLIPFVHNRAHRLTAQRIDEATPALANEMRADKDQLRAQFAVVARRLETNIDNLKKKSTHLGAELGRRESENRRLRERLDDHAARTAAVEARDRAMRDQLRVAEEEAEYKSSELHAMQREIADKLAAFDKMSGELEKTMQVASTRLDELTTAKSRLEALKARDMLLLSVIGNPAQWYAPDGVSPFATPAQQPPASHSNNNGEGAEGPTLVPPK